jgi:hypothetical protein
MLPASLAGSPRTEADPNRASVTTWIAVLAAMIGSFMAILNIQITNASLLRRSAPPSAATSPKIMAGRPSSSSTCCRPS